MIIEAKANLEDKRTLATYHITLETIEVDEFGIPDEQRVIVHKSQGADINWHLWVSNYSELIGEAYRVTHVIEVDRNILTEF